MHVTLERLHETPRAQGEIQLLDAGIYRAAQGENYPAHVHQALELIVYQEGAIDLIVDKPTNTAKSNSVADTVKPVIEHPITIRTRPGVALLIPAGCVHADRALTPYAQVYLQLNDPQSSYKFPTQYQLLEDTDQSLEKLTLTLIQEWHTQAAYHERMMVLLLEQLSIMLHRVGSNSRISEAEKLVRRAERLLEAHFTTNLSVQNLAEELGIAPSTLRGYFAKLRQKSPKAYSLELRLKHATDLLRTSDLSLEEVAEATGYFSASHLSRHIKRATGNTPGTYRAATE